MPEIPIEAILAIAGTFGAAIAYYYRGKKDKALSEFIRGRSDLQNFLVEMLPLPLPETEEIDKATIKDALADAGIDAGEGRDSDEGVFLTFTDGRYLAPTPDSLNRATDVMSITEWLPYQPEIFDCDEFGGLFWTLTKLVNGVNSVGYVLDWSAGHSYNVIVDSDGGVTFLEPQEDITVEVEPDSDYELEKGQIIF